MLAHAVPRDPDSGPVRRAPLAGVAPGAFPPYLRAQAARVVALNPGATLVTERGIVNARRQDSALAAYDLLRELRDLGTGTGRAPSSRAT